MRAPPDMRPIGLDSIDRILLYPDRPPFNAHALSYTHEGICTLAKTVRTLEIEYLVQDEFAEHVVFDALTARVPPIVPCCFNWFAVSLISYLRLVSLVDLANRKQWSTADLAAKENLGEIRTACRAYALAVAPEVLTWRNKVAAHFAATDPKSEDTSGTLDLSLMNSCGYRYPHFYAGFFKVADADLPCWSLTETFDRLGPRLWPEIHLPPPVRPPKVPEPSPSATGTP